MRVLHIITGLGVGGAEMMLCKLLTALADQPVSSHVISLTDGGPLAAEIARLGVPVESMGLGSPLGMPRVLWCLARRIREIEPDVVQSWMYHADLLGGVAARLARPFAARKTPIVWNIRLSEVDRQFVKRSTRMVIGCLARLSGHMPATILVNAQASCGTHVELGYTPGKFELIPNGFDLDLFRPDTAARAELRDELGVAPDTVLVGMAARFDAQKDYRSFCEAAAQVCAARPDIVFVACGSGVTDANRELSTYYDKPMSGLRLLGLRADMPRVHAALDIAVSTSISEGFANAIGEAMCCGVPCVVTAVGDSRKIVGASGTVVAPSDPAAMAAAILRIADMVPARRRALGEQARQRMMQYYGINQVARDYMDVWNRVSAGG